MFRFARVVAILGVDATDRLGALGRGDTAVDPMGGSIPGFLLPLQRRPPELWRGISAVRNCLRHVGQRVTCSLSSSRFGAHWSDFFFPWTLAETATGL